MAVGFPLYFLSRPRYTHITVEMVRPVRTGFQMVALVLRLLRLARPCVFTVTSGGAVSYSGSCRAAALASWRSALRCGAPAVFVCGPSVVRVRGLW